MSELSVPGLPFHFIFSNEPIVSFLFMAFKLLLMREKKNNQTKPAPMILQKVFLTGWCDEYPVLQKCLQKSAYYKMSNLELLLKPEQFCIVIILREAVRIKKCFMKCLTEGLDNDVVNTYRHAWI